MIMSATNGSCERRDFHQSWREGRFGRQHHSNPSAASASQPNNSASYTLLNSRYLQQRQERATNNIRLSRHVSFIVVSMCFLCAHTAGTTLPNEARSVAASARLLGSPPQFGRGQLAVPEFQSTEGKDFAPDSKVQLQLRTEHDSAPPADRQTFARQGRTSENMDPHISKFSPDAGSRRGFDHTAGEGDGFPPFRALEPSPLDRNEALLKQEHELSSARSSSRSRSQRESERAASERLVADSSLDVDCGWCRIPHPLKIQRGGEDVHLISRAGGNTLLAVFDGVGGWAELGVDPAQYARRLSALLEAEFIRNHHKIAAQPSPLLGFLSAAFRLLESSGLPGSCTACAALLTKDGALHVLNVGDSGLQVVRDGVSVFATHEQQHYFNCPFQLGKGSDDTPADADYYVLEDLAEDDYVVLATDGVWDNLFEGDFLAQLDLARSCEHVARSLSEMAHRNGRDPTYGSPFAVNAQRHGMRYRGGKLDDVTVVVSRLVRNTAESTEASDVSAMDDSGEAS